MNRREFHYTDGTSDKFWAIALHCTTYTLHFGRKGTAGQQQTQEFATPEAAAAAYEKAIAEKLKKGYIEVHPIHFLQEALERIERCIRQQAPAAANHLQPGLSRSEIDAQLADFPYTLPDEVYHLFGWHNGFAEIQEFGLLPAYLFLPLEACLSEYRQTLDVYRNLPGVDDWEQLCNPRWFPIFCEQGNYYVVAGAETPQEAAPVLDNFSEDPDVRVLFDNLTQMMQAIAECWETGLYCIKQADNGFCYVLEKDEAAVQQVWLQYQSQRSTNVHVLLNELTHDLTPEQRQDAYQDLVNTRHPEALAVLQQALQATSQADQEHCCQLLYQVGQLRSPAAASTILSYLDHSDLQIRFAAASALVWAIGYNVLQQTSDLDSWVEPTLQLLQEGEPWMGLRDVVMLLGIMGDRRALTPLLQLLHQPSHESGYDIFGRDIQMATIKALLRLKDPSIADHFNQLAWDNSDPAICLAAGRALRAIGDERGIDIIHRLIQSDLPTIRDVARRVLALEPDEFLNYG